MLHKSIGKQIISGNKVTMKYKSIILDGVVYNPDKDGILDLPKEVKNKYISKLSADEIKTSKKDSDNTESSKDKGLSEMTVKELKEIAKKNKIGKFKKMNKDELIKAIEKK